MPFSNPRNAATSYLILRHLYEGDVIEWPLADAHPLRMLFDSLERGGLLARWSRIWPLTDRYRLTEKGISAIEAVYRPSGADVFFERIRAQNLPPAQRRAHLQASRLDPVIWPILHDPHTHWSLIGEDFGRYYRYFWEDQIPPRRILPAIGNADRAGASGLRGSSHYHEPYHDSRVGGTLIDLDLAAGNQGRVDPTYSDFDVS